MDTVEENNPEEVNQIDGLLATFTAGKSLRKLSKRIAAKPQVEQDTDTGGTVQERLDTAVNSVQIDNSTTDDTPIIELPVKRKVTFSAPVPEVDDENLFESEETEEERNSMKVTEETKVEAESMEISVDFQNQSSVRESDTESVISKQDNLSIPSSDTDGELEGEQGRRREPILKYQSLNFDQNIQDIFKRGSATSISTHDRFIAVGFTSGEIALFDFYGNCLQDTPKKVQSTRINQVSLDKDGEYFASCSEDGEVVVTGFSSSEKEHNITVDSKGPVTSVALDPGYAKPNSGRKILAAVENKVIFCEKGFWGFKQRELCQEEGTIRNIIWEGQFASWITHIGVHIFDMTTMTKVALIEKPEETETSNWRILWIDDSNFVVSFSSIIRTYSIKQTVATTSRFAFVDSQSVIEYQVELVHEFTIHSEVCGIGMMDKMMILLILRNNVPEIKMYNTQNDYKQAYSDPLNIRDYELLNSSNFFLVSITEEKQFFVFSPKDIILLEERDKDDKIDWYLDIDDWDTALTKARRWDKHLRRHSFLTIGMNYLDKLIDEEKFSKAGQLCETILGENKTLWETQIKRFEDFKPSQVKEIAPYLPYKKITRLDQEVYERILLEFLENDMENFYHYISLWPYDLYRPIKIMDEIDKYRRMHTVDNNTMLRALAKLYEYDTNDANDAAALKIYLQISDPGIFDLIEKRRMFGYTKDKIMRLMDLDQERATQLFIDNYNEKELQVYRICENLDSNEAYLLKYLDALFFSSDMGPHVTKDYQDRMVKMYAATNSAKLMEFLKTAQDYNQQEAKALCILHNRFEERVFLQGAMGGKEAQEALGIIVTELLDIMMAIEFCKEHQDNTELWEDLINYSKNNPEFVCKLLDHVGLIEPDKLNPATLVKEIEPGLRFGEDLKLKESVRQILLDYKLQITLQESCMDILDTDCYNLTCRRVKMAQRGVRVGVKVETCLLCGRKLVGYNEDEEEDILEDLTVFSDRF